MRPKYYHDRTVKQLKKGGKVYVKLKGPESNWVPGQIKTYRRNSAHIEQARNPRSYPHNSGDQSMSSREREFENGESRCYSN
jgi:hypothetical protein